jgi:hypothetical protein
MRYIFYSGAPILGKILRKTTFSRSGGKTGISNEAFERGFEDILSASDGDRKEAIFQAAALLGGVVLARAVQDPRLSMRFFRVCDRR